MPQRCLVKPKNFWSMHTERADNRAEHALVQRCQGRQSATVMLVVIGILLAGHLKAVIAQDL